MKSLNQANRSEGVIKAKTLMDAHMTFWTVSLWKDETAVRKYMSSGDHKKAMPYLQRWCSEAATANALVDGNDIPDADFLFELIKSNGKPSKVNRPNANHLTKTYAPPMFKN